jgi:rhamnosyltransferase
MTISIIIPCQNEKADISGLLEDIRRQKIAFSSEVIRIDGVRPAGQARNAGAAKAQGQYLVFLDCDIRLAQEDFLSNLINPLLRNDKIGGTCAAIRIPQDSTDFQKRCAREIPHSESPVVSVLTDVQVASSACFAVRRELFEKVGGFPAVLPRGEDSVISAAIQQAGRRTVLVPQTICFHSAPKNFLELIKLSLRNGRGASYVDVFFPELNLDVDPRSVVHFSSRKNVFERTSRFISTLLQAIGQGHFLLLTTKVFYALGYAWGVVRHQIFRQKEFSRKPQR